MGKKHKNSGNRNYSQKKVTTKNDRQTKSKNKNIQGKNFESQKAKNQEFKNANIKNTKFNSEVKQISNMETKEKSENIQNQNNPNEDLSQTVKMNINQAKDISPSTNNELETKTDLDKRLVLDEAKKKDIVKIYDRYQEQLNQKSSSGWKILSLILILIVISLAVCIVIMTNKKDDLECKIEDIPNDSKTQIDNVNTNKKEKYLFLGDSIFYQYKTYDFFKDYDTINTGVNGITALKTLENVEESVYQYNPTTIFILLGTNDLYYDYTPESTFEHLKNLIDKIHTDKPEIKINVLSILPINKTDDPKVSKEANGNKTNDQINEVNEKLRKYCEEENFNYINIHDILLDENGNLNLAYSYEGLHITDLGYHHITMELLKYFKK